MLAIECLFSKSHFLIQFKFFEIYLIQKPIESMFTFFCSCQRKKAKWKIVVVLSLKFFVVAYDLICSKISTSLLFFFLCSIIEISFCIVCRIFPWDGIQRCRFVIISQKDGFSLILFCCSVQQDYYLVNIFLFILWGYWRRGILFCLLFCLHFLNL